MGADMSVADAILKEDYLGPLRTALNVATPVLDRLVKNTRDIAGREAWIPVEMALSQGGGARSETGVLPVAGAGSYKELKVPLKHYYGTLGATGFVIRQTNKGEKGSFAKIVDLEAKGLRKMLGLILAHDFYLGHTLSGVTTQGPVTTVQLAADANMEYFFINMVIDVVVAATGVAVANGLGVTITAVDKANKTIDITGAGVTVVAGTHIVVRTLTYGQTVTPLFSLIDDTIDIHGVTTSSFDAWKSTVNAAFGAFSVSKLQEEIDNVLVASGKYPTAIYGDYERQRKYFETLTANPRYVAIGNGAPKMMDGGFRTLEYSGGGSPIAWIADRLMPSGSLLIVHEPDLQVFTPGDWEFIEVGGTAWLPDIYGAAATDSYKAVLFRDMEMGAMNRNSHAKLLAIT
jgi:hypothetical protein